MYKASWDKHSAMVQELNINEKAFRAWKRNVSDRLQGVVSLQKPSVRSLVALSFAENEGRALSYEDILKIVGDHQIFGEASTNIPILSLRVAVSELAKTLRNRPNCEFRISNLKEGRTAKFVLEKKSSGSFITPSFDGELIRFGKQEGSATDPKQIARGIVRDGGGLPFASLYATYRAAAWWLSSSTESAMKKKDYEARALKGLKLLPLLKGPRVGFIGLATGEGLGEVGLLSNLLSDPTHSVDYLAVDSSDVLLLSHTKLIHEKFSEEVQSGQLRFCPVVGDAYQLQEIVKQVREIKDSRFLFDIPILCTFLGNCIGNAEDREWEIFKAIHSAIPVSQPLITLVGASLVRYQANSNEIIPEKYTLEPFLLETPRHLMHDLGLLVPVSQKGEAVDPSLSQEFVFSPNMPEATSVLPPIPYKTPSGIEGTVYRYYYELRNAVRTWDGEQSIGKGEKVLLYSIIKYDLESLLHFLKARGYEIRRPNNAFDVLSIKADEEEFRYAVFAAIRSTRPK